LSEHQQRKNRLRREWYITNAIGFALLAILMLAKISQPLGDVIYDHFIRFGGFHPVNNVIIISVDDHSLQELGGWPLKREVYTRLLKQLNTGQTRPKAIAFDLLFLDPTPFDDEFAAEMTKLPVVLPLEFKVNEDAKQTLHPFYPVYPIAQAVTLGHINLSFDKDGVIRGFQTQEQQWKHLSLALHAKGEQTPTRAEGTSRYYRFRIVDPQIGFPMVSLSDALNSQITPTIFKDKYVLIGVTAPSLGDRYPTLYSGKDSTSTPGVEILASILNASLKDQLILIGPQLLVFALSCGAILLMMHSLVRLTPRIALVFSAFFLVFVLSVSYFSLSIFNVWLDPAASIVVLITLHPIWAWRRLEALVSFMQDKTSNLVQLKQAVQSNSANKGSREVILRYTRLLDQAVEWAQNELTFLSQIVDEIPDAIAIFDAQDHLLLYNQRMTSLFDASHLNLGKSGCRQYHPRWCVCHFGQCHPQRNR
jgi:CHASE2 domain-containing sensor protein